MTCELHVSGRENVPLTCKSHVKHHFFACGMHWRVPYTSIEEIRSVTCDHTSVNKKAYHWRVFTRQTKKGRDKILAFDVYEARPRSKSVKDCTWSFLLLTCTKHVNRIKKLKKNINWKIYGLTCAIHVTLKGFCSIWLTLTCKHTSVKADGYSDVYSTRQH